MGDSVLKPDTTSERLLFCEDCSERHISHSTILERTMISSQMADVLSENEIELGQKVKIL